MRKGGQCEIIREENMTPLKAKLALIKSERAGEYGTNQIKLPYLFWTGEEGRGELHKQIGQLNAGLKKSFLFRRRMMAPVSSIYRQYELPGLHRYKPVPVSEVNIELIGRHYVKAPPPMTEQLNDQSYSGLPEQSLYEVSTPFILRYLHRRWFCHCEQKLQGGCPYDVSPKRRVIHGR